MKEIIRIDFKLYLKQTMRIVYQYSQQLNFYYHQNDLKKNKIEHDVLDQIVKEETKLERNLGK